MYKYINFLLFLSINFEILIFAKESNDAEFTNIVCIPDNVTVINTTCRLVSRRHKPRAISVELEIVKSLPNANVRFEVFRRFNGYKPFIVNYTFDACMAAQNKGLNPLTRILKNWIIENSNLHIPCPFKPQHFQIKEFYPDLRLVPSLLPKGRYRADIVVMHKSNWKNVITAQLHFEMKDNF